MFANVMDQSEKEKFLELIHKIAQCDEDYSEEEEELLNNYKIELGIQDVKDTDTLEGLVEFFAGKTPELKKIVFFELYGMIMADGKIASKESELIEMLWYCFIWSVMLINRLLLISSYSLVRLSVSRATVCAHHTVTVSILEILYFMNI